MSRVERLKWHATAVVEKPRAREDELPYIGLENIESYTGRLVEGVADDAIDGTSAICFREGDVLFGKLRPYLAKAHAARKAGRCTSEALVLRPRASIHQRFLFYWTVSDRFLSAVNASTYGARMPRASWSFIGNSPVAVPPLDEQRAIADFLDEKTAAIDGLIAKKERLLALLDEQRQALITRAVTQGLDPSVPMKDSGVSWIGAIPAQWEARRLKQICRLESGHTPRKSNDEFWREEDRTIPWVSLNDTKSLDLNDYIDDTAVKITPIGMANSSAHLIPAGAVVFNRDGARVGLCAITTRPMCVSQHMIAWVCGPSVEKEYLLHALYAMRDEIYRITTGATIPTIGMPDVKTMAIPLPPLDEQRQIASHLFALRARFRETTASAQRQIESLREYRQAVITAAVTGQLDVRSRQARAMEPAA